MFIRLNGSPKTLIVGDVETLQKFETYYPSDTISTPPPFWVVKNRDIIALQHFSLLCITTVKLLCLCSFFNIFTMKTKI